MWEVPPGYQCSILGTCLSLNACARIVRKTEGDSLGSLSDYDIHALAVFHAKTDNRAARLINKALDRACARAIARYRTATTPRELRSLWKKDLEAGHVRTAYWALMSHPDADRALLDEAFGEVHMLSHRVGYGRHERLARYEEVNARAKSLEAMVSDLRKEHAQAQTKSEDRERALEARVANLNSDLERWRDRALSLDEVAVARLRQENERLSRRLEKTQRSLDHALRRCSELEEASSRMEVEVNPEPSLPPLTQVESPSRTDLEPWSACSENPSLCGNCDLAGRCILYVGGERRMHPWLSRLVSSLNGELLLHDGGVEDGLGRLGGMCERADAVLCPLDRVSHAAVRQVKRACRSSGKSFVPLERSSMDAFEKGLVQIAEAI
ncbi:MAG: DUF2325 domain-containing protein [Myxococcota bacterium]